MEDIKISFEREMLPMKDLTPGELDQIQDEIARLYARLSLPLSTRVKRSIADDMKHWAWILAQCGRQVMLFIEMAAPGEDEPYTVYDAESVVSEMNALAERLRQPMGRFMRRKLEEELQAWIWHLDDHGYDVRPTERGYVLIGSEADYGEMLAALLDHAGELAQALRMGR